MEAVDLKGLGVALVTPFKSDYSIDFKALELLINKVVEGGADYLVVLGTTAETPTLFPNEKRSVAKFVKEYTGGKIPLVVGVGGNNTLRVVNEIQSRDLNGYSAILSVAPFYNKPTQEGIFQHFKLICDSSPLPIILYNVPSRTGVNISPSTTLRLARYSNKICGIKEASGNLKQSEEIIQNAPTGFMVISGNDADTYQLMKLGSTGVISVAANALPSLMKHLVELCREKRYYEAENLQNSLSIIISHLFEDGNPAGVKAVLADMEILENILRLPLLPVNKTLEEKLKKEISELINLNPELN